MCAVKSQLRGNVCNQNPLLRFPFIVTQLRFDHFGASRLTPGQACALAAALPAFAPRAPAYALYQPVGR